MDFIFASFVQRAEDVQFIRKARLTDTICCWGLLGLIAGAFSGLRRWHLSPVPLPRCTCAARPSPVPWPHPRRRPRVAPDPGRGGREAHPDHLQDREPDRRAELRQHPGGDRRWGDAVSVSAWVAGLGFLGVSAAAGCSGWRAATRPCGPPHTQQPPTPELHSLTLSPHPTTPSHHRQA